MEYEIIFTDVAEAQAQQLLDYLIFEIKNTQAAYNVKQDMKETARRLSYIAGSLKLCDSPALHALGYRIIHFKRHNYFMLYKVVEHQVYIIGIYHDLQDFEQLLQ